MASSSGSSDLFTLFNLGLVILGFTIWYVAYQTYYWFLASTEKYVAKTSASLLAKGQCPNCEAKGTLIIVGEKDSLIGLHCAACLHGFIVREGAWGPSLQEDLGLTSFFASKARLAAITYRAADTNETNTETSKED